jgi:hypothetical protein
MESKKINQLATEMTPTGSDLTIIGDPITGVSRKITLLQLSATIGTGADLQGVTDNGATTTNPIAIGGLTITGLATGVLKSDSGVISSVPFGAANGVATLGGDGKVPSIQLPSYVDDVVEVANFAALPVTGETGKIYITLDNNKVYRWTGSIYVEIAANNAVWGAITGTLSNQTDLQSALNAKQNTITLTTTGTSGASTLVGSTLNIPNYAPDLSGYVPYTGATANVNLGTFDLTADVITGATGSFASSGGSDTFAINHSSGSGIALNITKGGNGEGLYINKTSGSGNAATIIGTLNATTLVKSGGTSSQFLKADGSVDSTSYQSSITLTTTGTSGAATLVGATLNIPNYGSALSGYLPLTGGTLTGTTSFDGSGGTASPITLIFNTGINRLLTPVVRFYGATSIASNYVELFGTNATSNRTIQFPDASGTIAITSDLSAYLPLAGGIMTGQIVLKESSSSTDFTKGLRFPNDPFGGSDDIAGLRLYNSTGENMVLELYTGNDGATDVINFATGIGGTANNDSVKINGNKIWNAGNLSTPITGTGTRTINYLPLFSGSTNSIENSSVYEVFSPEENIGVYVANTLKVQNALSVTGNISGNNITAYNINVTDTGIPSNGMYRSAANTLAFSTNSENRLTIGSTGAATFSSSVTVTSESDSSSSLIQHWALNSLPNQYNLKLNTIVSSGLVKYSFDLRNNNSDFPNNLVLTNGNVGIGTSPHTALTIGGAKDVVYGINLGTQTPTWPSVSRYIGIGNTNGSIATNSGFSGVEFGGPDSADEGYLAFHTHDNGVASGERMRITKGGEVFFNTITGSGNLEKYNFASNTNQTVRFNNTNNTNGNIGIVNILGANCNNTSSLHFVTSAGGNQFEVYGNGTYATSSDIRLKKNIETARNGYLDDINKIRIVKYNWNNQEDGQAKELGVIAQELEEIFPSLVQDGAKIDETEPYKVVKYSVFIPMLIKAIQEQQAQIEELKAMILAKN